MCSGACARLCWRHGGAIKVGKLDNQNKGCANTGDEASQSLGFAQAPSPTGPGADLRSTVVNFALHVAETDCLCALLLALAWPADAEQQQKARDELHRH
jgi:hypothetical protein